MSFLIRPASLPDAGDLLRLSSSLSARGFLTLPSDTKGIEHLIKLSGRSFSDQLDDRDEGEYLFVLRDEEKSRVIGCSLIVARHGTPESPHTYFEVLKVQKAYRRLNKIFKHQILRLRLDAEGSTELGGLILDPAYRGHPEKLGKQISFARFLYIHRHPEKFMDRLLVELLPPLTPDGKSLFWESLGRKFTEVDYHEADRISRGDKSFITSLFPEGDLYTAFLPDEARALIGEVGPETKPVAKMLEEVGFCYLGQIDPFDGGPHYGAMRQVIKIEKVEAFFEKSSVQLKFD
ncbi:MAG: arginine N-succinyltransferase [Deltaproteobacteria bacterium]|nr:arginine N-succinyltransferase [Deltaproteobacteria bacterium]MBI4373544.1 arginine N-succinyltransferase [Deltaproteobacteria bacterium]